MTDEHLLTLWMVGRGYGDRDIDIFLHDVDESNIHYRDWFGHCANERAVICYNPTFSPICKTPPWYYRGLSSSKNVPRNIKMIYQFKVHHAGKGWTTFEAEFANKEQYDRLSRPSLSNG